jgi:hypothetical protein
MGSGSTASWLERRRPPVGLPESRQTCDDPDGDAGQYRAVRLPMDWSQVAFHYAVVDK